MKQTFFICVITSLFLSCTSDKMYLDSNSITKHQKKGYTYLLNGKAINISDFYFDKRNIKSITKSKSAKTINTEQLNANSLYRTVKEIKGESILPECNVYVVDGVVRNDKFVIENTIKIKKVDYITPGDAQKYGHNAYNGITLITTF